MGGAAMTTKKNPKKTAESSVAAMTAAMKAVSPTASHLWIDIMNESAEFIVKRLQHDVETQQAMLRCKSPTELMQLQSAFVQTAMKQYSEEAAHLFKMMTEAGAEAVKENRSAKARSYNDVPL
jgi:hypothetical protein